jgi:hypothetical protein
LPRVVSIFWNSLTVFAFVEEGVDDAGLESPECGIKNATARPPARINRPSLRGVFINFRTSAGK